MDMWEKLQREKSITCDETLALKDDDGFFRSSYNWMATQMISKIGPPPIKCKYPIWSWYIHDGINKKPDLRRSGYGMPGEEMVCIQLEMPGSKVLLSDFDLWHCVLNYGYIGNSSNEKELDDEWDWLEKLSKEESKNIIEESWQKIFNVAEPLNSGFYSTGMYIQGTFWELTLEEVEKVKIFKAR